MAVSVFITAVFITAVFIAAVFIAAVFIAAVFSAAHIPKPAYGDGHYFLAVHYSLLMS